MICKICKKQIGKKDNYCRVTDYKQGKFEMEFYYHTQCFIDRINGRDNLDKMMARGMMARAIKLLRRAEGVVE